LRLIITHGWPGSVIEQLKIVEPLTNPTANSASAGRLRCAVIVDLMGRQVHPELRGIHSNISGVFAPNGDKAALTDAPTPSGLLVDEKLAYERLAFVYAKRIGYGYQMGLRPQALYGIADSPVGIAGYFLDHDACGLAMISRAFDGQPAGLTRDDELDDVTLTWLTNTFTSGARLYWECLENKISYPGCRERVS
jgi:hypothetical protein